MGQVAYCISVIMHGGGHEACIHRTVKYSHQDEKMRTRYDGVFKWNGMKAAVAVHNGVQLKATYHQIRAPHALGE